MLACSAAVAVLAAAGLAVAQSADGGRSAGENVLASVARSLASTSTATPPPLTSTPQAVPVRVVTVPALAPPAETGSSAQQSDQSPALAATSTDPPPAQPVEPVESAPQAPEPVPAPADAPVVAPYNTVMGWRGDEKIAYLTFDDGPGPATGRVLDILAAAGVKATFCQVGQRVAEAPAMAQRVVADGHTLCNHSWDHHSPFDGLSPADLDSQITRTQEAFVRATGAGARYLRAPEGRFGVVGGTIEQAAQRARTLPLGWGVDSVDWKKPGTDAIVNNVLQNVSPGAIVLLHDGGGADREQTLDALPKIISGLQAAGYTLAALPPDPGG